MADLCELERRCIEQIRKIQECHRSELEPLMKQLANIRSLMPPPPISVPQETYDRFIAMTPTTHTESDRG